MFTESHPEITHLMAIPVLKATVWTNLKQPVNPFIKNEVCKKNTKVVTVGAAVQIRILGTQKSCHRIFFTYLSRSRQEILLKRLFFFLTDTLTSWWGTSCSSHSAQHRKMQHSKILTCAFEQRRPSITTWKTRIMFVNNSIKQKIISEVCCIMFNVVTVTFNVVECPHNRLVPVTAYITAAINSCSFTMFSLYDQNKSTKAACQVTENMESTKSFIWKTFT